MSQLADITLITRVVAWGDTRAFDRLVQRYQSTVRRFLLSLTCGDAALSDDLAQDVFLKAYTGIATFRNLSSFSTWLYGIAYHCFYDYLRARKDIDGLEVDDATACRLSTPSDSEKIGREMDVYQALSTLKEAERTCITLFYMEDTNIDKIAGIMNIPANTVKSHLARGKEKLASYLKRNGYDEHGR
jgi:RNA polymerase sigma-70 factor (ECF subfamily)